MILYSRRLNRGLNVRSSLLLSTLIPLLRMILSKISYGLSLLARSKLVLTWITIHLTLSSKVLRTSMGIRWLLKSIQMLWWCSSAILRSQGSKTIFLFKLIELVIRSAWIHIAGIGVPAWHACVGVSRIVLIRTLTQLLARIIVTR